MNWRERTKRAMDIGDAAADHPPGPERNGYINKACGGDPQLKQQVLDYLQTEEELFQESTAVLNHAAADFSPGRQAGEPALLQSILTGDSTSFAPGTRLGPYEI